MAKESFSLLNAIVTKATWTNGYCELTTSGGTIIKDGEKGEAGTLTIGTSQIDQKNCTTENLSNSKAVFTKLHLDRTINTSGILLDEGEASFNNTTYGYSASGNQALLDRLHEQAENNDIKFVSLNQVGGSAESSTVVGIDKNGNFVDYMGNALNEEQQKILENGIQTSLDNVDIRQGSDGVYHYYNKTTNKELYIDSSKAKEVNEALAVKAPTLTVPKQVVAPEKYLLGLAGNAAYTENIYNNITNAIGTTMTVENSSDQLKNL